MHHAQKYPQTAPYVSLACGVESIIASASGAGSSPELYPGRWTPQENPEKTKEKEETGQGIETEISPKSEGFGCPEVGMPDFSESDQLVRTRFKIALKSFLVSREICIDNCKKAAFRFLSSEI